MRASVFNDAALRKHAGQFAWLSIDTEKAKNASFLEKFPITAWPTFLVVEPATEKIALRWYGTATVEQMARLLEDGLLAVGGGSSGAAEAALVRADRLNADRQFAGAAVAYQEALKAGGPDWPRRPRVVESLVMGLMFARDQERCAQVAREEAPKLSRDRSFANAVATGLTCATSASATAAWRAGAIRELRPLAEEAVRLPDLFSDDRSGLYEVLVGLREQEKDTAAVKQLAAEWLRFLDEDARRAPNTEARSSQDGYRVYAALRLGDPARAIPALQASERDLPDDYNPPARLATIYRELGRLDDALAAINRALAKSYGPRRLGFYQTRAALLEKKADKEAAKRSIQEAIEYAESLPRAQAPQQTIERLKQQLERFQ